ncbi:MAG TPA: cellulase family glycosylhydrolase [Lacunisphaera sp.]|nr:cellulase family glycosylhydrolase [Lacunisphaera sp.]
MNVRLTPALLILKLLLASCALAQTPPPAAAPTAFSASPAEARATSALPVIAVQGNRFVNPKGETVIFRGLALSDPAELLRKGQWGRRYFEKAKEWNANVVRIPVHPSDWRGLGEEKYLKMLDDAVQWSGELGMHVIIDWHTIGNLLTGVFHRPIYLTSRDETFRFWYAIAQRYKANPTVAMYELYNEPTNVDGQMGPMPWGDYRILIEQLTFMVQTINPRAIVLVAGFNWGYDLSQVRYDPVQAKNVAYVTHPYPQKREEIQEASWERDWGFVAAKYPVVATEFGFMAAGDRGAHRPVIADEKYGEAIIAFFEKRGISWTPWVFDAEWSPMLIDDWNYTPTRQGKFFQEKLRQLNK